MGIVLRRLKAIQGFSKDIKFRNSAEFNEEYLETV